MQFQVYSLRAIPGGRLEADWGTLLHHEHFDELGLNELVRRSILAAAGNRLGPVPLVLPYQDRRTNRAWHIAQMRYETAYHEPSGAIVLGNPEDRMFESFLAGALLLRRGAVGDPFPLFWHDCRIWNMADAAIALPHLMRQHGLPPQLPAFEGDVEVHWTLRFAGEGASAWADVPNRSTAAFLDQYKPASHCLQRALRIWMAYRFLHDLDVFQHPKAVMPYILYSVMRPFYSRQKSQLTFHALEPAKIRRGLYRLDSPVSRMLRVVQSRLHASGRPASCYDPDGALRMVASMYATIPRLLGALLTQEAFFMEELIRFADVVHTARTRPVESGIGVQPVTAGRDLQQAIRGRLRRTYGGQVHPELAPLVLLATTSGLAYSQGKPSALEAALRLRETKSGEEFRVSSQFSYATNGPGSALFQHGTDSYSDCDPLYADNDSGGALGPDTAGPEAGR